MLSGPFDRIDQFDRIDHFEKIVQIVYDLVKVDAYDAGQLLKKISVWPQLIRLNIFWL